jgi:protein-disulfide isomerase
MHGKLFDHPRNLSFDTIVADARTIALQLGPFQRCVTGDGQQQVRRDVASARRLQLTSTPAFFVGTVEPDREQLRVTSTIFGAQGMEAFRQAIATAAESLPKQ